MGPQLKPMLSDLAKGRFKYSHQGKPKPHAPREPLLTLAEVEDRLKLPSKELTRMFKNCTGRDAPLPVTHSHTTGHLYRLSEVRAYLKTKEQLQ